MTAAPKKVAVLMGGFSSEREVSLVSGGAVSKALQELGHNVRAIDVQRDAVGLVQALTEYKPDVIFNALHGRMGEDGAVQGLLEYVGLPYTHSGVLASAIAMDKPTMKAVALTHGIPCAPSFVVTREEILAKGYPMEPPFVIKPTNEGSSVGVRIVKNNDHKNAIEEDGWIYGERVLIEAFVPGRELTVAVLGDGKTAKALAVTELRPRDQEFYDYTAKYSSGATEHLLPAPIPAPIEAEVKQLTEKAYLAAGCQGAARCDFRWDDSKPGTDGIFFLEMNTQPGMTELSLLPEQAAFAGMNFNELISWILEHPTCPAS